MKLVQSLVVAAALAIPAVSSFAQSLTPNDNNSKTGMINRLLPPSGFVMRKKNPAQSAGFLKLNAR